MSLCEHGWEMCEECSDHFEQEIAKLSAEYQGVKAALFGTAARASRLTGLLTQMVEPDTETKGSCCSGECHYCGVDIQMGEKHKVDCAWALAREEIKDWLVAREAIK